MRQLTLENFNVSDEEKTAPNKSEEIPVLQDDKEFQNYINFSQGEKDDKNNSNSAVGSNRKQFFHNPIPLL